MNHVVSQRFVRCLIELKKRNIVRSARQFALQLHYLPQSLNEIMKGRRDVTIDLIHRAAEMFDINPTYLFSGEGSMFTYEVTASGLRLHTVVTDHSGDEKILHVPISALDRYAQESSTPDAYRELPYIHLPDLEEEEETYRSFELAGDSMSPLLQEGESVICRYVDPGDWKVEIAEGQTCVVVTQAGVRVGNVQNRLGEDGLIQLHPANQNVAPFLVQEDDIREIWQVKRVYKPYRKEGSTSRHPKEEEGHGDFLSMLSMQHQLLMDMKRDLDQLLTEKDKSYEGSKHRR